MLLLPVGKTREAWGPSKEQTGKAWGTSKEQTGKARGPSKEHFFCEIGEH